MLNYKIYKNKNKKSAGYGRFYARSVVNETTNIEQAGTAVKLDNLAIFSVGITSKGAESGAAFSPAKHIKAYRLRARPTGKFNAHSLKTATHVQEQTEYQIQKKKKKTETGTPQG